MKKIGLYFGSFNPIHNGHVHIANYALSKLHLDLLFFVVSPQNPFKHKTDLLSFESRVEMVKIICDQNSNYQVCDIEKYLPTPSYTYDTLKELEKQYPNAQFTIIMGGDNFLTIDKWKQSEYIMSQSLLIIPRILHDDNAKTNPYERLLMKKDNITQKNGNCNIIIADDVKLMLISSTEIRHKIKNHMNVNDSVDEKVLKYIYDNNLYQNGKL
mgnify:CR=1 FL=1